MRKIALFATFLLLAGTGSALAIPGAPASAPILTASDSVQQVAQSKDKKAKKTKKKNTKSGGGMNMEGMPPGHKM
ncbi:MAG: hypothetical protein AB1490_00790 [Pseudomonadota bacterium]